MIKRKVKRLTHEVFILSLTAGSTGIVLITLSGETREYGIWITAASFVCHMVGLAIGGQRTTVPLECDAVSAERRGSPESVGKAGTLCTAK